MRKEMKKKRGVKRAEKKRKKEVHERGRKD
jgi:hypothetical protein